MWKNKDTWYALTMSHLAITIKPKASGRKLIIELDADKFERLASVFGMFNPDFLSSIVRSEADFRAGRARKIRSLKELRKA